MAAATASTDFAQVTYEVFEAVMREIEAGEDLPADRKKYNDTQKTQVKQMAETKKDWAQTYLAKRVHEEATAATGRNKGKEEEKWKSKASTVESMRREQNKKKAQVDKAKKEKREAAKRQQEITVESMSTRHWNQNQRSKEDAANKESPETLQAPVKPKGALTGGMEAMHNRIKKKMDAEEEDQESSMARTPDKPSGALGSAGKGAPVKDY